MLNILISAAFIGRTLIRGQVIVRGRRLFQWPKGAALIWGFEEIRYMYFFNSMIFGNQIWSSICWWNSVELLHGLYSDVTSTHVWAITIYCYSSLFSIWEWRSALSQLVVVWECIIARSQGNFGFSHAT